MVCVPLSGTLSSDALSFGKDGGRHSLVDSTLPLAPSQLEVAVVTPLLTPTEKRQGCKQRSLGGHLVLPWQSALACF